MKFFIYLRIIFDFLLLFFDILRLTFFLFSKRKRKIFIMLEGGFGHTIVGPHYLNLSEKANWILILAYDKKFLAD